MDLENADLRKKYTYHVPFWIDEKNFSPLSGSCEIMSLGYRYLCRGKELWLPITLLSGQCFNWYQRDLCEFEGIVGDYVIRLHQENVNGDVQYKIMNELSKEMDNHESINLFLRNHFQLDVDMEPLREQWSNSDPRMREVVASLSGMRVIRQDPFECTMSFICSSNNNIERIKQMLEK